MELTAFEGEYPVAFLTAMLHGYKTTPDDV
jgi:hypothetical protein